MEPWSYEELRHGNRLLKSPLDERALSRRYALVGGIPKWALDRSEHFHIVIEVCSAVRRASTRIVRKAWEDAVGGLIAATESSILGHKIYQIAPEEDRTSCSPIPAGVFATYHIQAMIEMSDDEDFRTFFRELGMIKVAGPFAGHVFEAYAHLVIERGATALVGFRLLTPNPSVPKSLNIWTGEYSEGQLFHGFHRAEELDEAATKATNSYWEATGHNFPSIDGFAVRENEEGLCVHFILVATNKKGKSRKMSYKDLQNYVNRITKGWKGDRARLFVCLWFVLRADVYERKVDSCRKEHKPQANRCFEPIKDWTIDTHNCHGLVQGVVKFDWTKVRAIPIKQMIDSWWSANKLEFMDRCKEYEETYLESRMSQLSSNLDDE